MIQNYSDLTRLEMEKIDKEKTIVMIPLGATEQHGSQAPLGTDAMIAGAMPDYYDITASLAHHGFKKLVFLICHGGNRPVVDMLARQARADFGVLPFVLASGAFFHPDVQATISEGNAWDFHGGEMETSMVLAIRPEAVKLDLSETGYKAGGFAGKKVIRFGGEHALTWMGEDLQTADGRPIGIGGDPRGATAEKGRIILETSARELVPALLEIRDW